MIFGQLGADWIQGDGSHGDRRHTVDSAARPIEDFAGPGHRRPDWIEGNGGDDTIFGGLGQDNLIGGSSDLYSLTIPDLRPNGRDTIFGGAGTAHRPQRLGATSRPNGHARDADVILGDNGNIYALVGVIGGTRTFYLAFNYDNYGGVIQIIPRASCSSTTRSAAPRPTRAATT